MKTYLFENWTILPSLNEIRNEFQTIHIQPKMMDVLVLLIENQREIVEKDLIMKRIWKDIFVTESSLNKIISTLRKHLGDDSKNPKIIRTIPKKGYVFICDVSRQDNNAVKAY